VITWPRSEFIVPVAVKGVRVQGGVAHLSLGDDEAGVVSENSDDTFA
jgi:hypothetical protein